MLKGRFWMLVPALLLAACGQQAAPTATGSEDVPWSYTAPEGQLKALFLDPGPNTLSFEPLLSATNGYGPFETDRSNGEAAAGDGKPITLNGTVYAKGLGVHSNGSLVYSLTNFKGATCSTFTAQIGVDDEVGSRGSVRFQVLTGATPASAVQVYDSGVMTGSSATKTVTVDVSTSKVLVLRVTDAGDGNFYDHADWAVPTINCVAAARPAPGTLDTGFDSSGFGTYDNGTRRVPTLTALQPDGKIIGYGANISSGWFLGRLDQDGHLDSTFVNRAENLFQPLEDSASALGLAVYPDGRILTLSRGHLPRPIPGVNTDFYFLQRFLADGSIDPSFGNGAALNVMGDKNMRNFPSLQFINEAGAVTSLALQPDGKILLGGVDAGHFFVRRLLVNGSNDPAFGASGRVTTAFVPEQELANLKSLTVQPDNKILVVGGGSFFFGVPVFRWVVTRLLPDGNLDTTFGTGGTALPNFGRFAGAAWTAKVLRDGKILLAGNEGTAIGDFCVLRQLTSSGQNDPMHLNAVNDIANNNFTNNISLALQEDGKAIIGGCTSDPTFGGATPALFRFNSDGTYDRTFGKSLNITAVVGAAVTDSRSVFIQPANLGGKIISGLNVVNRVWP